MRICLILEGCYPYIFGGVSTWMHQYINEMKEHEFVLWVIGANAKDKGKFVYELPKNVVEVHEVFLDDALRLKDSGKMLHAFTEEETNSLKELMLCRRPNWEILFRLYHDQKLNPMSFLRSEEFLNILTECCIKDYPYTPFADAFHTMRSMLLPVLYLMGSEVPKADVYHAICTGYGGLLACLGGYVYKKKVLLTEHGIYTREREEEIIRAKWVQPAFKKQWISFFYMLSDIIYTRAFLVSALFTNAMHAQIQMGCDKEKCRVVENGINYERLSPIPLKEEDGWVDIGAIVRLAPIKDIKTMIYAFYELCTTREHVRLHIMGGVDDEEYAQECYALVDQLHLENVIFTGRVDIISYMEKLDFTILTSISEGQPLSVLESFAARRPCVTTDVGCCRELLNGNEEDRYGKAGYCVPPMYREGLAQAMDRMCASRARRLRMGENAQKRVKAYYRKEEMIEKYRKMYREVKRQMAGIGFELKKLFQKRGLAATAKAYGYAGVICTGPMLLGIVLLVGIAFICDHTGATRHNRELLNCMITYTLLASLTVTSFFSMVVTRYIADMLYEERHEAVLFSFWGSTAILLVVGGIMYGIFLLFSGINLIEQFLCLEFFGELIVTWNAMSYLTAIKDYKGILISFITAVAVSLLVGFLLILIGIPHVEALMIAVTIGYGIMLLWDVTLLYRYFPQREISAFFFLRWVDQFLPLAFTGLFTNIGLFAHLVIMWCGPIRVHVQGLFYGAPYHDVPAMIAYLTILITTVNFVVSVEVNFYPKYRNYYSLFNDKGEIKDILQAGNEMRKVLNMELKYTALKQLLTTALAISIGELLLTYLPLGFNDLMEGYFRTLCVGYGLYAIANTMMLILLYFTDYKGALFATGMFAACTTTFTCVSLFFPQVYYGFGFLLGSAVFFLICTLRLGYFIKKLPYYILSVQPIVAEDKTGFFTRLGCFLEEKIERGDKLEKI